MSECSKGKTLRRVASIWEALDKFTNIRDLAGLQYRRVVVNLYGATEFREGNVFLSYLADMRHVVLH